MSEKKATEAETTFNHSGPSRGSSQVSTGLYIKNESVSFPPTRIGGASEDAPLLSSSSRVSTNFSQRAPPPFLVHASAAMHTAIGL